MNRRKLLAFLGATPVAAVIPEIAEAKPEIPQNTPILGELRYAAEHAPVYYYNGYGPGYALPSHTHTCNTSYQSGIYGASGVATMIAVLKIWDGEKWVNEDSQEGVAVKNKVLRS